MPLNRDAVFGSMKVFFRRLSQRKTLSSVVRDQNDLIQLRPNAMGLCQLVAIGIGGTIGIGIFNLTGRAAARFAGPSVIISLVLGGIVALLSAFSFAEMSSMMITPGSAYTYAYVAAGGLYFNLTISWSFIAFYQLAASTVATSWSRYLVNFIDLISDHNATRYVVQAPVVWSEANDEFQTTGQVINLPAIGISVAITIVLLLGIRTTSRTNLVLVLFKLTVLLIFIFAGSVYVKQENFSPFFPANTGETKEFGVTGMLNAASFTFFAYNGFESISPATNEAKRPAQNVPWAILISLIVTILFYIGIATVMVGLVDYKQLDTTSPLTEAIKATPYGLWLQVLLDLGALASLATVALTMLLAQTRIFYVMSHDGLLPKFFAKISQRRNIPWLNTLICGSVCAVLSGVCPVDIIGEGASFSVIIIYMIVHACVIVMRYTHRRADRGFRIPLGPFFPGLGFLLCILLLVNTTTGTIIRYGIWMGLGHVHYFAYGYSHSKLGQALVNEMNRADNMEFGVRHHSESTSTQLSYLADSKAADEEPTSEPLETLHETELS